MRDNRPERLAKLRTAMAAANIDGLLVSALANIRYLTGFSGTSAMLFVTARELHFVSDFRYDTQVKLEVGDFARVCIEPSSLWTGLWNIIHKIQPLDIVGFESTHLLHRDFQRLLSEGSRYQWRPQNGIIETLRERKDETEVALIEHAGAIATRALHDTLPYIRPAAKELEIAGVLEKALRDHGCEEFPFPTIVASGERAALPHARPTERTIRKGEFVLLDFGAQYRGYCSDITRTVVAGKANEEQRHVYGIVRDANAIASSEVRAGMSGQDADALARGYIEQHGFGKAFGHSLGHGLGLEVHEAPRLAKTAEAELSEGAVVTIEPGIYRPGWGGIRIEDDVHLSAGGPRILTDFPRELLEVA
jgi:Xaa-Pro aminopeptidase